MSTDGGREELSRAVQELRDLLLQPSATGYIQIGSIATGDITADPIVRSTRRPDYVYLDDIEITRDPASTGPSGGRNWVSEVNARSSRDVELQAERYQAYQRADALDAQIMRREDAEWSQQEARIERGKQIPEREVRFSWLHGPEVE